MEALFTCFFPPYPDEELNSKLREFVSEAERNDRYGRRIDTNPLFIHAQKNQLSHLTPEQIYENYIQHKLSQAIEEHEPIDVDEFLMM